MGIDVIILALKIIIVVSIFYVWVVRYSNIVKEFEEYKLPNWFRDIMGIIKLTACGMIISGNSPLIIVATSILTVLMLAAVSSHIKAKHNLLQMAPSFLLMCLSIIVGLDTYLYLI